MKSTKTESHVKINPVQAWFLATRPKTLSVSIIPIILGSLLSWTILPAIEWNLLLCGVLSAICIQVGTNLINDALDFKKGVDTSERIGPKRVTQSGFLSFKQVYAGGIITFILAVLFAIPLALHGGPLVLAVIIAGILSGYLYTGGPYPLSHLGIADLFVVLFYGFVAVGLMYYVQTGFVDAKVLLAGLQMGLLATVIIAINNLRDKCGDAKAGRRTLPVRFGVNFGRWEITVAALGPFLLNLLWLKFDLLLSTIFPFVSLPVAISLVRFVWVTEPGPIYNRFFGMAVLLHFSFGVFMILGIVLN